MFSSYRVVSRGILYTGSLTNNFIRSKCLGMIEGGQHGCEDPRLINRPFLGTARQRHRAPVHFFYVRGRGNEITRLKCRYMLINTLHTLVTSTNRLAFTIFFFPFLSFFFFFIYSWKIDRRWIFNFFGEMDINFIM